MNRRTVLADVRNADRPAVARVGAQTTSDGTSLYRGVAIGIVIAVSLGLFVRELRGV